MQRSVIAAGALAAALALALAGRAQAAGGAYVVVGGSDGAREAVHSALEASRFDWSLVSQEITIRITDCGCAGASPGDILLDEQMLTSGRFGPRYAWGIVQHEYAHQVAYLLGARQRSRVTHWLGGSDWCHEDRSAAREDHACERFASSLAWAYWPRRRNIMSSEAVVSASEFRAGLNAILGLRERHRRARLLPSRRSSPTLRKAS